MHCFGVVWVINLFSLSGFFGMFGTFGRSSKQTGPPAKKIPEVPGLRSLELIGDLIGHSGLCRYGMRIMWHKPMDADVWEFFN